jgi:hypothetical protein
VVSRGVARLMGVGAAVIAALIVTLGSGPATATAAPGRTPAPTTISIVSGDLDGKIEVQRSSQSELFGRLLTEVSWLAKATPQTTAPTSKALGPKYTVTILYKTAAQQTYDLYPLATGGPRAHRPAKQPSGKVTDGWFYGRLTMSESLRLAGAPLKAKPDVVPGGIGGGAGEDVSADEIDPIAGINNFLDQMRRLFLLNGAVLMVVLFGLAGVAFLIRRRV